MNWDTFEGQWKQFKGTVRSKFAKLTDDDVEFAAGKRERLVGRLQERYGVQKDEAERNVDQLIATL